MARVVIKVAIDQFTRIFRAPHHQNLEDQHQHKNLQTLTNHISKERGEQGECNELSAEATKPTPAAETTKTAIGKIEQKLQKILIKTPLSPLPNLTSNQTL